MRSSEVNRHAAGSVIKRARVALLSGAFFSGAFFGLSGIAAAVEPTVQTLRASDGAILLDARDAIGEASRVEFAWTLVDRPAGSEALLEDIASPTPRLVPDVDGAYTVELVTLRDGIADAPRRIVLQSDNLAPVVRASASDAPAAGRTIQLSAERSFDPDGDRLGFAWQIVSAPEGSMAALSDASALRPSFTPDVDGDYTIALSATDEYGLTTRREMTLASLALSVEADAGPDRRASVGEAVALDPFASTSADGTPLTAEWTVLSAPDGNATTIADGSELDPPLVGRSVLVPDLAGEYLVGLTTTDGAVRSTDVVAIVAGDGAGNGGNVAPVASPGMDRTIGAGEPVALDASASTDADGNALTYAWSIVSAPAGSFSAVVPALDGGPFATLLTDVPGDYVAQVTVEDGRSVSVDTVTISTNAVAPRIAGLADAVLPADRIAPVGIDAPAGADAYGWSVLDLGTPLAGLYARFGDEAARATTIDFNPDPDVLPNIAREFGRYAMVAFERGHVKGPVAGRGFVGGQLVGNNGASFGLGLADEDLTGTPVLRVTGSVDGQRTDVRGDVLLRCCESGAKLRVSGGDVDVDPALSIADVRASIASFSNDLAGRGPNSAIAGGSSAGGNGKGKGKGGGGSSPLVFDAAPDADGIAVFEVSDLKSIARYSGGLDVRPNGASVIVVNVLDSNAHWQQVRALGAFADPGVAAKVVWNFPHAHQVQIHSDLPGSVLAPNARVHVKNRTTVTGAVAGNRVDMFGAIAGLGYGAADAFIEFPPPVEAAVVQVAATEGALTSRGTALLTTGNIAPVSAIAASAERADVGTPIDLTAASMDANGDALAHEWSLLSAPEGSEAALTINGGTARIVPDKRGPFVVQLASTDGTLDGEPATVVVTGNNQDPIIASAPVELGKEEEPYGYAVAASDPDGDQLTYTLASAPDGMTIDEATGLIEWLPLLEGDYDVEVLVEDGLGGETRQAFSITIEPGNEPPVIAAIADETRRPGEAYAVTVTATDPDDDPITFTVQGLPASATFDAATGELRFLPGDDDVGAIDLNFVASDGELTATETAVLTVEPWPETDPTRLSGRVLDADDFADGIETPVAGATVSVQGIDVTTEADGTFAFDALDAAGTFGVVANGLAVMDADGDYYGVDAREATLYRNAPNALDAPFLLRSLAEGETLLTEVDESLPSDLRSCSIQRVDVAGGLSAPLGSLGLSNPDVIAAGTRAVVWSSPDGTDYARADEATIAADGQTLEGLTASVPSGSRVVVTPLPPVGEASDLQPDGRATLSLLGDGNMRTSFTLPGYMSLGQRREASFVYNSAAAAPRPTILADVTLPADAALADALAVELYVDGQRMPGEITVDLTSAEKVETATPVQGAESVASIAVTFDASGFATGSYPYELLVFGVHDCAAAAASVEGQVFVNNRTNTPYGTGWKPAEEQQLHIQDDGDIILEEPNGTLKTFTTPNEASTDDGFEPGLQVQFFKLPFRNYDMRQEFAGLPPIPVTKYTLVSDEGVTAVSHTVTNLDFPDILNRFDSPNLYHIGNNRRLEWYSNRRGGDDYWFTNSTNMELFGARFSGYIYIPEGGEVSFRVGVDNYFLLKVGGRRLGLKNYDSDFRWITLETVHLDAGYHPFEMLFGETFIENNLVLEARGGGLPNGLVLPEYFFWKIPASEGGTFVSPVAEFSELRRLENGGYVRTMTDGTTYTFDADGLHTASTDASGNTTTYERDARGRLAAIVDPVGLRTEYVYDSDRVSLVRYPDGREHRVFYNEVGHFTGYVSPTLELPLVLTRPDGTEVTLGDEAALLAYPSDEFSFAGTTIRYVYDDKGRMVAEIDEAGQRTEHSYNGAGQLTETRQPDGSSVKVAVAKSLGLATFGVDLGAPSEARFVAPEDRVMELEDARGNVAFQEVNEFGAIIGTLDPIGRETRYERNEDNLVTRIIAPSSATASGTLVTEMDYDDAGNIIAMREAVGTSYERRTIYEYEPERSRLVRKLDAAGRQALYAYDENGNMVTEILPGGDRRSWTYDERGLLLTATDENARTVSFTYDDAGRQVSMVDEKGVSTTYARDDAGNPVLALEAAGADVQRLAMTFFDAKNRPIAELNGEEEATLYGYSPRGELVMVRDATGIESRRTHDDKGRIATMTDPASGTSRVTYDASDNVTSVTMPDGTVQVLAYDAVNRITESVDPLGHRRQVAYDERDNVIAVTDGRGNTTTFTYDALDRQTSRTNALGETWSFEYDERDLRIVTVKPDGTRVKYDYDVRDRLVAMYVQDAYATLRTYAYDGAGNLVRAASAVGQPAELVFDFAYDERDQLRRASLADAPLAPGLTFTYEYDALGRRITMRDNAGGVTQYLYDAADRLTSLTLPSGRTVEMDHDAAGRRTRVTHANDLTTLMRFDTESGTGRLVSMEHGLLPIGQGDGGDWTPGSALHNLLGRHDYGYDESGNITSIAETADAPRMRAYSLDPIERLTTVVDHTGSALEAYTLDEEGNRVASHLASFHVTDPANRLTEDEEHLFEYDANGNLLSKTVKASGLAWRYGYSTYDELIRIERFPNGLGGASDLWIGYSYDALGRRIAERRIGPNGAILGGTVRHGDGDHVAVEIALGSDGAFDPGSTRWITHSDRTDDLVALTPSAASGLIGTGAPSPMAPVDAPIPPADASFSFHTDHQGSVRAITDDAGAVVSEYAYGAYGDIERSVSSLAQPYRYTGREYDPETGLYHYRARAYDPATGRFLQEDPIWFEAGDLNVYRYTWNNPTNWVDPSGLTASSGYGSLAANAPRIARPAASIGNSISCIFGSIAGVLDLAGQAADQGATLTAISFVRTGTEVALECGASGKFMKRIRARSCKGGIDVFPMIVGTATAIVEAVNQRFVQGNSFTADTPVLTTEGYVPIQDVTPGMKVAAIEEQSGRVVWRTVLETYERIAPGVLHLTVEDADGTIERLTTTPEHPFHVEGWDGSLSAVLADLGGDLGGDLSDGADVTRTLAATNDGALAGAVFPADAPLADRTATPSLDDHALARLFPTEGRTAFGTWVKAGALKIGDAISTRQSVEGANDNEALTLRSIKRDDADQRVYNFAVQSLPGEVTHNYLVGDAEWWTHNRKGLGGNPFAGKTPSQAADRMREKGFEPGKRRTPCGCVRDWTNPRTGRTWSIDCTGYEPFDHVDIKYRKRPGGTAPGERWRKVRLPF